MRFGNSRYWLFQTCGWGLFSLVNIFFAVTFNKFNDRFMIRLSLFIVLGIFFTHLMRWIAHRGNLLWKPLNRQIPGFVLLTFFIAIIIGLIEVLVYKEFDLEA